MKTYWRDIISGKVFELPEEPRTIQVTATRIPRSKYREIKRAEREAWERVNNADNDGRPFKDAGR